MELAHAIRGWLTAHQSGLSSSTQDDVEQIAIAANDCGYGDVDCNSLSERGRQRIVDQAAEHSSLGPSAIGEFLTIVIGWAADEDPIPPSRSSSSDADDDGAVEPELDELLSDGDSRPSSDATLLGETLPGDSVDGEPLDLPDDSLVRGVVDDESGEGSEAASLLQTLDQSTNPAEPSSVFGDLTSAGDAGAVGIGASDDLVDSPAGTSSSIFSEAAQDTEQSVDWITVAYFVAAAICFGFVIYLYITN